MKDLFSGATIPLGTLVALAVAKLVLTPGSLGAGFVGGVIGPAMLIGSCVGGAVGVILIPLFPDLGLSPVIFAMVGTTAMLSGSLHAPLFAALIVFEMAGVYEMLVPLMMAAAIGRGLAAPSRPAPSTRLVSASWASIFVPADSPVTGTSDPGRRRLTERQPKGGVQDSARSAGVGARATG